MQHYIRSRFAVVCPRRSRQLNTYSKMSIAEHKIDRVNSPNCRWLYSSRGKEMLENATTVNTIQSDEDIKYNSYVVRGILLTQAGLSTLLNVTFFVFLAINRDLVKRRRITYHIGNLAVADWLFSSCRLCCNIIEIVKVDSLTLSRVFSNISNTSAFASFSSVLLMTLERIVVLKKPFTWIEILPVKKILKVSASSYHNYPLPS